MVYSTIKNDQIAGRRATVHAPPAKKTKQVVVVGTGYVGLPLCVYAAQANYDVIGFDVDTNKLARLNKGESSEISPTEQGLLKSSDVTFTAKRSKIAGADMYVICVPTPVNENHQPDLEPLESACATVAAVMDPGSLVIVESTVNPSVSEDVLIPLLESHSGLTVGDDFSYAYCPERVNPGDEIYTTHNIPRVLGGYDEKSLRRAQEFYETVLDAPVKQMGSLKETEAVKMVENAFRDVNIAFVNEIAMAFDREGIDVKNVIDGAATKPFAFMAHYPGCGVGGHCIPIDPYYLIEYGEQHGFSHEFLKRARLVNESMPIYLVEKLEKTLSGEGRTLAGTTVALLGLSYKRDVGDMRESPALIIKQELERCGANVLVYDPYIANRSDVSDLATALNAADVAVIATDHAEFTKLRPEDFARYDVSVVLDGRNCLPREQFRTQAAVRYAGIGV